MSNNNSEFLKAVTGYKYLPTVLVDAINSYNENKNKEVDPLVKEVDSFDRSYMYSDSASVFRTWNRVEGELKERINDSNYSDELKSALYTGLTLRGGDQLREAFPELNQKVSGNIIELDHLLTSGKYDEGRLDTIYSKLGELANVVSEANLGGCRRYVWSPRADKLTREELSGLPKIALPKHLHDRLQVILKDISVADIEYAVEVRRLLGTYVNVGTENSPNYQYATLIPANNYTASLSGDYVLTITHNETNKSISIFI